MEIKSVLYVILIIFIIYIILRSFQSQVRLTGLSDAKSTQEIEPTVIQDTNNPHMNFTYSIWVYVDDWNYKFGQPKIVLSRRDENSRQSPVIALDNNENSLKVSMFVYNESDSGENFTCSVKYVPLQKWVHVMVSVYNRTLDIYVDGKLSRSCLLPGVPKVDKTKNILITPGGGFSGNTAGFQYFDTESEPQKAYEIYRSGWTGNFFNNIFYGISRYGVKLSLMADGEESGYVQL